MMFDATLKDFTLECANTVELIDTFFNNSEGQSFGDVAFLIRYDLELWILNTHSNSLPIWIVGW